MVLASASDTTPIAELANIADRIMEVAISNVPTPVTANISAVSPSSQVFDMEKLHAEITCLKDEIKSLRRVACECSPCHR